VYDYFQIIIMGVLALNIIHCLEHYVCTTFRKLAMFPFSGRRKAKHNLFHDYNEFSINMDKTRATRSREATS